MVSHSGSEKVVWSNPAWDSVDVLKFACSLLYVLRGFALDALSKDMQIR